MSIRMVANPVLSVSEAAEYAGAHANTIRAWINNGFLKAARSGPKGRFRIKERDLQNLLEGEGIAQER